CVWLFPLNDCKTRSRDILFILDCRNEVKEQIEFIQTATDYISKDKFRQKNHHTFMAFSANGWIESNELADIEEISITCGHSYPFND
ncbi:G-protein coupled receptor GRL101, partial [Biomphalaria glabrata]